MNDIANVQRFLTLMVNKGKITREEADKKLAKHKAKSEAKAKYKADKNKLTKSEMQSLLEVLSSD